MTDEQAAQEAPQTGVVETETTAPAAETQPTEAGQETQQPQQKQNQVPFKERIGQLYGRAKHAEREAESLRQRVAELEAATAPKQQAPTLEQYDYDEDKFRSAQIEHVAEQKVASYLQQQKEQQIAQQQEAQRQEQFNGFINKANEYAATNPEYSELTQQAMAAGIEFPAGVQEVILNSDDGVKIQHALLRDPGLIMELEQMSPTMQAFKLSQIASGFQTNKISNAPEPAQTLGGGSVVNPTASNADISKMSPKQFYEWRSKQ